MGPPCWEEAGVEVEEQPEHQAIGSEIESLQNEGIDPEKGEEIIEIEPVIMTEHGINVGKEGRTENETQEN